MIDQKESGERPTVLDAPAAGPDTIVAPLEHLRAFEAQLYSPETEEAVKAELKDHPDQLDAFFAKRLHLTAAIATLNAEQLREIREDLQAEVEGLSRGIDDLAGASGHLDAAVDWAKALDGVLSVVGKIVSLV